jgi:hypothetical protein
VAAGRRHPARHPLNLPEPSWVIALRGNIIITAGGRDVGIHQPGLHDPYENCFLFSAPGRPTRPPDNGRLSGTSGHDAWRGHGKRRAAVCDSDTLSGTSVEEERRRSGVRVSQTPSTAQGTDLAVGQLQTIPDELRLRSSATVHVTRSFLHVTGER